MLEIRLVYYPGDSERFEYNPPPKLEVHLNENVSSIEEAAIILRHALRRIESYERVPEITLHRVQKEEPTHEQGH